MIDASAATELLHGVTVPDGWKIEQMRGLPQYVVVTAPGQSGQSGGSVTIDFKVRGFRAGCYVTYGKMSGGTYGGRGWKQALVRNAVRWLSEAVG